MLTDERKDHHSIRTVSDISRDDRTIIATCRLRTATDTFKEHYSIDDLNEWFQVRFGLCSTIFITYFHVNI